MNDRHSINWDQLIANLPSSSSESVDFSSERCVDKDQDKRSTWRPAWGPKRPRWSWYWKTPVKT